MKNTVFIAITLLLLSCSSPEEAATSSAPTPQTGLTTKVWLGSDAPLTPEEMVDIEKEIQGRLDMLELIAADSFGQFEGYAVENVESSTSAFEISIYNSDTAEIREAINSYLDLIQGAYQVKILEEIHPVE